MDGGAQWAQGGGCAALPFLLREGTKRPLHNRPHPSPHPNTLSVNRRSLLLPVLESVRTLWPALVWCNGPRARSDAPAVVFKQARTFRNRLAHHQPLSDTERRRAVAVFMQLALMCGADVDSSCIASGVRLRDVGLQDVRRARAEAQALAMCSTASKFTVHLRAGAGSYGVVFLVRAAAPCCSFCEL